MAVQRFGVSQVSEFDPLTIFAGDFQRIPEAVVAGANLPFLSVVTRTGETTATSHPDLPVGTPIIGLYSGTGTIYGVLYDVQGNSLGEMDITVGTETKTVKALLNGESSTVLTSGEFLGKNLYFGGTATWEAAEVALRAANAPMWFRSNRT